MAMYTVCATARDVPSRPCGVVDAVSAAEALVAAEAMRRRGELQFLPPGALLTVRASTRSEADDYLDFMVVKPGTAPINGADEFAPRGRRVALAYFEKLWRREAGRPPAGPARRPAG